jgi:hypothetical protein
MSHKWLNAKTYQLKLKHPIALRITQNKHRFITFWTARGQPEFTD